MLYPTGYNQVHTSFEVIYIKILQERVKKCLPHVKKDSRPEEVAASSVLEEWMMMNNKIPVDLEFDMKKSSEICVELQIIQITKNHKWLI